MDALRPLGGDLPPLPEATRPGSPQGAATFEGELGRALAAVEGLQQDADREAEKLARGGGNLHEAALALEKADVALRLAAKVRNKIVEAYQEVMRMNV
ncbi:MAG TPA: flagellar hook-basal body complex protein FliE [Anaeromyxobacteraceae bacterium]